MLGHVKDIGADPSRPETRLYATAAAQPYHTDSADIVGLLCLQPAMEGGLSAVTSSAAVHNQVLAQRPDLAAALAGDFYCDRKGEVPSGKQPWWRMPVFAYAGGRMVSMCAPPDSRPGSPQAGSRARREGCGPAPFSGAPSSGLPQVRPLVHLRRAGPLPGAAPPDAAAGEARRPQRAGGSSRAGRLAPAHLSSAACAAGRRLRRWTWRTVWPPAVRSGWTWSSARVTCSCCTTTMQAPPRSVPASPLRSGAPLPRLWFRV